MTALIATLAAALFGTSDFLGGLASRRTSPLQVTIVSQSAGFAVLAICALVFPPVVWTDPRILWGVVAGVSGGLGVLSLYAGLATGRMSLVAPVTAALSGSIPAAVGIFVKGESLHLSGLTGIALALFAVVIVSSTAEDDGAGDGRRAVVLAVLAGAGFAGSLLSYAQAPVETGLAPLALARITTVGLLLCVALVRRSPAIPWSAPIGLIACVGLVDASANVAQVVAIRMGPLAVATVLGALYPVVTLLLARFVLQERLRGWQRVGIGLALVAVVLTALP